MLHKEVLEPETFAVLESLMQNPVFGSFALTAGTALALRSARRQSDDLDLWTADATFMYGGELRVNAEREIRKTIACEHRVNDPLRSVFMVKNQKKFPGTHFAGSFTLFVDANTQYSLTK